MKKIKLTLKSISTPLSRAEMKKILAGSGSGDNCHNLPCDASTPCPFLLPVYACGCTPAGVCISLK